MSDDPSDRRGDRTGADPAAGEAPVSGDGAKWARRLGLLDGKINVPDNFDDPLPDEILAEFEGPLMPNPSSLSKPPAPSGATKTNPHSRLSWR